ncbi:MAG: hypothetical protein DI586_03545 [Micavibrio aeruginosavorus]|uniref:Uncharacterized protein n=1 Tax=Micavibrio aeruginosavorus TaxID=349221 RepID=A0A2W5FRM5_9BACT|nr:MAG: hypothetical protein DI586_03545 [Micavibrio aeruginosavorus]
MMPSALLEKIHREEIISQVSDYFAIARTILVSELGGNPDKYGTDELIKVVEIVAISMNTLATFSIVTKGGASHD